MFSACRGTTRAGPITGGGGKGREGYYFNDRFLSPVSVDYLYYRQLLTLVSAIKSLVFNVHGAAYKQLHKIL